jgi:hypothetical protein
MKLNVARKHYVVSGRSFYVVGLVFTNGMSEMGIREIDIWDLSEDSTRDLCVLLKCD